MIYNGIDLSEWDIRTREIVKKHDDLPRKRFDGWEDLYNGNMKSIELEYIRHIGMRIFGYALDYSCSPEYRKEYPADAAFLDSKAIEQYNEAKKIFELLKELDTTPTWSWGALAAERIELYDVTLSRRRR